MKKSIFLITILFSFYSCTSTAQDKFSVETLAKKMTNYNKEEVTFKSVVDSHKGKVTVIEIWASWCGDCVKAMPNLKAMQENIPDVDYVFISMDKNMEAWFNGIDKHELKGDHYWVSDGMKGEFGKSIKLDWIPRYIVIDKTGKIVLFRAVETDFEKMNSVLKNLI